MSYCDSSYGECKDIRESTIREVHTIRGDITSWKPQQHKTEMLSPNEAEYMELLEAAKEHKSTEMPLQEIAYVETPGYIYGDN